MVAAARSGLTRRGLLQRVSAAVAAPIAAACAARISSPTAPPSATGPASATGRASPTAQRIGGSLSILQWSHVVPAFDAYLDQWTAQWGARNGVAVRIDRIPYADLPARIAVEATAKSGHDLVANFSSGLAAVYQPSLVDISDVCERAASTYGGWLPAGEAIGKVNGSWYGFPDYAMPLLSTWRTDLWRSAGFTADHLATWDDLFDHAARLKAAGTPVGCAMSTSSYAEHTWRSLLWSYGAAEFSSDGTKVAIDSPETRRVLDLAKALFANEEPAVTTWTDGDAARYLASGKGSWIYSPLDAYRATETQAPSIAGQIRLDGPLAGPAASVCSTLFTVYGIWKFSRNVEAARQFLIDYSDDWQNQMTASVGHNYPLLRSHAQKPMPILGADPKLDHLQDIGSFLRIVGYPGPATAAANDALNRHVVSDLFASYSTGKLTADSAIAEAARRLGESLATFPA